jgi:hypothetical protein
VIAGGILGSILASTATGAAAGGVLGGLIGLGIPEDEARHYEGQLRDGRTLVVVQEKLRLPEAVDILRRCTRGGGSAAAGRREELVGTSGAPQARG